MSSFTIQQDGARYSFRILPSLPSGERYELVQGQGRNETHIAYFYVGHWGNPPRMREASREAARYAITNGEAAHQRRRIRRRRP